jgi:hypothetical protein
MALTTYTELKTSIADWLNRSDLTATIPDFISLAEAQIERTLRTRQMLTRTTLTIDGEFESTQSDFLETRALKLTSTNPVTPLSFMTMDALDEEATKFILSQRQMQAIRQRSFTLQSWRSCLQAWRLIFF